MHFFGVFRVFFSLFFNPLGRFWGELDSGFSERHFLVEGRGRVWPDPRPSGEGRGQTSHHCIGMIHLPIPETKYLIHYKHCYLFIQRPQTPCIGQYLVRKIITSLEFSIPLNLDILKHQSKYTLYIHKNI